MTKRFKRFLVIAIVFAITFVNYGLPLQAIAAESTGFLFGANLFKKDEIALNAYFDGDVAQKSKVLNVNDIARLTVEVNPLIEGYLKSGILKFNFTNGNENNFRIQGITVESEEKEIVPEADSTQKVEMVEDVEEIIQNQPVEKEETEDEITLPGFLTEGTKETLQNVKSIPGGLGGLLEGSDIEEILQQDPTQNDNQEENVVVDNTSTEIPEEEKLTSTVENKPETQDEEKEEVTENKDLSDLLVSEKTEEVETTILEEILVVNENEIELNNVIDNTKIYVDIVYKQGETVKIEDLYNNIKLTLEGNYINKKLDVLEIAYEDEVTLGWEYSKEVDVISNYVKVSPFTVGENEGTILANDLIVRRTIKDPNYLPLKETNIKLIIPKINDKLPTAVNITADKLMATCGQELNEVEFTQDNWSYNAETGEMLITVRNEKAMVSQGDDKFTIVCRYEDYVNEETIALEKDIVVKVEEYSSNSNKVYEKVLKETEEKAIDAGEVISYTASATEEKINKGRINANYNAEVQYETEFSTILNVNLLTSDLLEEIKIEGFKDVYVDAENREFDASKDIMYKKVKLYYSEIKDMLEKGTTIDLLDENDNILHTLTQENTTDQDGCDLEITQRVKQAKIRINNIQTNGNITIEFVKVIAKSNYSLVEFNNFEKIVSKSKAFVKYVNMEERFALKEVETEKLFSESQTKATLNINKEYLSTVKDNYNVELKIELNNHLETSDLYKNPVFEIVFPGYIKVVEIQNMNLFHEDGLRVSDFKTFTQNGEVRLKLELEGAQKSFCESSLTNGSNIIINANIKVDEATPRKQDEIRLFYFNEAATNYQTETEWNIDKAIPGNIVAPTNGFDAEVIEYQAPVGLIAINSIENYDGLSSVLKSVKQGEVKDMLSVGKPAQKAKIRISTLNNTGNDCTDMVIVGRIPFEGNKHIETGKDLGSTLTIPMTSLIEEDPENKIKAKIYYSTKEDATRELYGTGNNWQETIEDISTIRSYLIVLEGTFNAGEILNYTYNVEIPANLPYEGKIYGTFTAYYNNHTEYAIVYEATTADKVGLETEPGPRIEASMSVDIGDGAEVKEGDLLTYTVNVKNTGSVTAENIKLHIDRPQFTSLVEMITEENQHDISSYGYYEIPDSYREIEFDSLEPGETREIKFLVKTLEFVPTTDVQKIDDCVIETNAIVKVENFAIETKTNTLKNKLNKANFITDLTASYSGKLTDTTDFVYNYKIENVSGQDMSNVIIKCRLPKELEYQKGYVEANKQVILENGFDEETNTVEFIVDVLKADSIARATLNITVASGAKDDVTPSLSVKADEVEIENAPDLYSHLYAGIIEAIEESNYVEAVKENEDYEFRVSISNVGEGKGSKILVETYPSENIKNLNVYYEGASNGTSYKEGNKYIAEIFNLEVNDVVNFVIKGKAADLEGQEKTIQNCIVVKYCDREVAKVDSNVVTILENTEKEVIEPLEQIGNIKYSDNYDERLLEKEENTDGILQEGNLKPSEIEEKLNIVENEEDKNYSLSGNIWFDEDANGQKDKNESLFGKLDVKLLLGNKTIKTTKTNSNGKYVFSNIEPDDYTVVFEFDGKQYEATTYNQANTDDKMNSMAIEFEAGKATSNEINIVDSNIEGINLGLQLRDEFNLSIDKVVTNAIVDMGDEIKEYDFEDLKLAKIEIKPNKLDGTIIDITYKIIVENIGNVEGYASMINDYIPPEMIFDENINEGWHLSKNGVLYNDSLKDTIIKPGEQKEILLVLSKRMKEDNTGTVSNKVAIMKAMNPKELKENLDRNMATQEILILVETGYTVPTITILFITTVLIIIVINKKKFIVTKDKSYKNDYKNKKFKMFKKLYK